jgi:hypothetical protein
VFAPKPADLAASREKGEQIPICDAVERTAGYLLSVHMASEGAAQSVHRPRHSPAPFAIAIDERLLKA